MEKTKILEERIQYNIISWFRNTYCLNFHSPQFCIFSVPNDGKDLAEQMRKKSTGMMSGVSDLIILMPSRCIFIEIKTDTGVQSENQKQFEKQVKALGFEYYLIRSLEQLKSQLNL